MKTLSLHPDDIEIGERHRALSGDAVNRIAASMKEIGLRQPISVRIVSEMILDGRITSGVPVLIAGAHRLAAAKSLGWQEIDCIETEDDAVAAEMWEIAENLHRLDLTKEQRNEHIRRYAELLEEQRLIVPQNAVQSKTSSNPKGAGRQKSIAREIADATGLSDDTVRRALNPPPVVVKMALEPESDEDATIREANAIVAAWNRARHAARELAMDQIDSPAFDRTRCA